MGTAWIWFRSALRGIGRLLADVGLALGPMLGALVLVLGMVSLVVLVAVGVAELASEDHRDLEVGTCFTTELVVHSELVEGDLEDPLMVEVVPCTEQHEYEVFHTFEFAADVEYPGEHELALLAFGGCSERFEGYVGHPYERSPLRLLPLVPSEYSWADDARWAVCTVSEQVGVRPEQRAGSVRVDAATVPGA
jgi:hypothetical protein